MILSVIIPVYNKKRYLPNLLGQVMEQRFRDYECLLIDDGSTDGSGAICDEFAARDGRFRVLHIPNGGVSHARNLGMSTARGEFITFIDSDDEIQVDYLENLMRCMEDSGTDLVISGYHKVAADGSVLQTVIPGRTGVMKFSELLPDFARKQLETGLYGCCVSKLFPRRLAENICFDESLRLAEDFDFYLNLYELIDSVCLDDHAGYLYLQDAENSTGSVASEDIDYLAQLRILFHYRSMLQKRVAYTGENRAIVDSRIGDYAYFVLFHTPLQEYKMRFLTLCCLCGAERLQPRGGKCLRRWLFFCLRHHLCSVAKGTMTLYRVARRIGKGRN